MSIATQITRLNNNIEAMKTTKQQIKDAMNNDFDIIANEQIEDYAELIENGLELYKDCIPSEVTNQATEISVTDAMKYSKNKLELFGNTEQASYEGKNLISISDGTYTGQGYTAVVSNGKITINGTGTSKPSIVEIPLDNPINWLANVPLLLSAFNPVAQGNTSETGNYFSLRIGSRDNPNVLSAILGNQNASASKTRTTDMEITRLQIRGYTGGEFNNFVCYPQLELDSNIGYYEPYVGGVPSPNPGYPQDIHVVTGENIIHVNNTDYLINLGSIELCKIGDYQDYLYKENGNWYKYGAVGKVIFVGTEAWVTASAADATRFICNTLYDTVIPKNQATVGSLLSDKFIARTANDTASNVQGIAIAASSKFVIYCEDTKNYNSTQFREWLSSNNVTVYYALGTPTTTQITDTTLISQLDAIYEHLQLTKGTNHITLTANDLKPYMKLSYKNLDNNE